MLKLLSTLALTLFRLIWLCLHVYLWEHNFFVSVHVERIKEVVCECKSLRP